MIPLSTSSQAVLPLPIDEAENTKTCFISLHGEVQPISLQWNLRVNSSRGILGKVFMPDTLRHKDGTASVENGMEVSQKN